MKGCFADLKKAVSNNEADETKKRYSAELARAVTSYDQQMKTIRKNIPSNTEGKAKAGKPKAKGKK